jgi:starch synthase
MTLIEAMAASVPVVSTAVGGIPEIVADGESGLLVGGPVPDLSRGADAAAAAGVRALAAALARVLDDAPLAGALAANALRKAREELSLDRIVERYLAIHARLAGARVPGAALALR